MHVIIALGAFPILAHVLPSTFSSFRCSVSQGCREAGLVLVPHSMAKMVPIPGTRLFGCQLRGVCLTWAMAVTTPTALSSPALVLLVVSAGSGIPPSQPKCTAGVCLWMSQPVSLDLALGSEGRELLSTSLLSQVSTQLPPKPQLEPLSDLSWTCSGCG